MNEKTEQALTIEQLAERYRRSPRTIRDWVSRGKLPRPAIGGMWLPAQIRQWERNLINRTQEIG